MSNTHSIDNNINKCSVCYCFNQVANCFGRVWKLLCNLPEFLVSLVIRLRKWVVSCFFDEHTKNISASITSSGPGVDPSSPSLSIENSCDPCIPFSYLVILDLIKDCSKKFFNDIEQIKTWNIDHERGRYSRAISLFFDAIETLQLDEPESLDDIKKIINHSYAIFCERSELHGKVILFDYLRSHPEKTLEDIIEQNQIYFLFFIIEAYYKKSIPK